MSTARFLQLTAIFSAGLVLAALGLNRWLAGAYFPFPLRLSWQAAGLAAVAAGPPMAVVFLLTRYDRFFMPKIMARMRLMKPLLIDLSLPERIAISVLAGFSEELLFRGFLQPLAGIAAASLVFGALHAVTFGYFLLASAMGFYLGWLLQAAGNLLVPIMVHALYDIFALDLLARIYLREERDASSSPPD